jgi:hypothetical protein
MSIKPSTGRQDGKLLPFLAKLLTPVAEVGFLQIRIPVVITAAQAFSLWS